MVYASLQMYWAGPLVGGLLAGLLYELVFAANMSTEKAKGMFTDKEYDDSKLAATTAATTSTA